MKNSQSTHQGGRSEVSIRGGFRALPIIAAMVASGIVQPAFATDRTWFGGTGDWGSATNWSPSGVPGLGDRAIINNGASTLTFNTGITGLNLFGGSLGGTGSLTLSGLSNWTAGSITGAASTNFDGGLSVTGASGKVIAGGRVLNLTDTTWSGNTAANNNAITFNSGTINNNGTWNDANASDSFMNHFSGTNAFNNIGTYNKQSNTSTTIEVVYNNTGTTNVNAGTLQLRGNGTHTGNFNIAAGSTLDFNNGTHNLNNITTSGDGTLQISGSTSFSFVNVNGGTHNTSVLISGGNLQGTNHAFAGLATWTAGNITGAASTDFDGGLSITGASGKVIAGGRVLNLTDTTWSGNTATNNNAITFNSGTINNNGTWNDANASDSFMNHFSGTNAFNNIGTYNKQSNTSTTIEVVYNNTGTTNVNAGTLQLRGNGTHTGNFNIAAGSTLDFNNGTHNLNNITTSGDGTLQISGSTSFSFVNVNGGTHNTSVLISGGNLQGTNHAFAGLATWTAGNITGAASTDFDGGLSITGASGKVIAGGRVLNLTDTTWSGNTAANNNAITFNSGTINNNGTWNDANASDSFMNHFSGTNAFNNIGTYNKQSNTSTTIEVVYNNTGTTNVNAGTLQLRGNGTHTGNFNIAAGSTLDFNNGTHNLNNITTSGDGTLQISGSTSFSFVNVNGGTHNTSVLISGGNLQGTNHAFAGLATWTAGNITGAASTDFDGGLSITGASGKVIAGGRVLNLTDTTWSGNTATNNNAITFNSGTINSNGTWNDANASDSFLNHFSGTNAFNNIGTYNKQSNTLTTVEVVYNNTGTTNVNAGTFRISHSFTNDGAIEVKPTAAFQVALSGATTFANSGTGEIRGNGTIITPTLGLTNSGVINPGPSGSIGHLTIDGDLNQAASGIINFELASLGSFDQLTVTDDVTLGGELAIGNLGYVPVIGDSFVVATFDQRLSGSTFSSVTHGFGSAVNFNVIYHEHDVTLAVTAVPEPESWAMLLAGLGLMGAIARRRRT